jgi:hypothetical protein
LSQRHHLMLTDSNSNLTVTIHETLTISYRIYSLGVDMLLGDGHDPQQLVIRSVNTLESVKDAIHPFPIRLKQTL